MHRFSNVAAWLLVLQVVFFSPAAHAIVGGDPNGVPADSPRSRVDPNVPSSPWAGVGSISVGDRDYTATLIDPRHVLTAAHVVNGARADSVTFTLNADGDASQRIAAQAIYVNPDYHGFTPASDGIVHADLAIVELSAPAPANVPTYALYTQPIKPGTLLTLVGYGAGGDGVHGVAEGSASSHWKRVGSNMADVLFPGLNGKKKLEAYLFDFDGPDASSSFVGGTTLGNAVEATLGVGDSGSPAFVLDDGVWRLAGVNTFVTGYRNGPARPGVFGTGGGGMLVSGYADWISATVGASAIVSPVPEPMSAAYWVGGLLMMVWVMKTRRDKAGA